MKKRSQKTPQIAKKICRIFQEGERLLLPPPHADAHGADRNFEVDFRVNGAIGTIVTKWDLFPVI